MPVLLELVLILEKLQHTEIFFMSKKSLYPYISILNPIRQTRWKTNNHFSSAPYFFINIF